MDKISESNKKVEFPRSADGLSRRNVLMAATVAAGALAAVPSVLAETAGSFGAPLVELYVPAGALTLEQRSAMIKGITDVMVKAAKQPPDRLPYRAARPFEPRCNIRIGGEAPGRQAHSQKAARRPWNDAGTCHLGSLLAVKLCRNVCSV